MDVPLATCTKNINQQRIGHRILASLKMMALSRILIEETCELTGARKLVCNFKNVSNPIVWLNSCSALAAD